ncbi:MAG: DUF2807 domain-containing protein [Candidatus Doudnabacteria bacterium]|nr:DUF2807 domain-containing protein [Candidatus Doudnabacteria bacterium]
MNKTISITLAGLVFNIEENAYPVLKEYLDSIKQLFAAQSYGQEVYSDIETSIAEQFRKKITETKVEVITLDDVNKVIKEMGTTVDFGADEKISNKSAASGKKLFRNSEDVIIAGVASGIAAYFGWDSTLVRVLFALAVIFGGWGIPLYIVLWIIMPEAKTSGEKLEMRGAAVTIKQLEQTVKEKTNQVKNSGLIGSVGRGISKVIKFFAKSIIAIIGGIIVFAAAVAAFAVTLMATIMLFNRNSPYVDPILTQALGNSEYYAGIVLVLMVVLVPLILLILAGVSLLRKKPLINLRIGFAMLFLWLSAALGTGVLATKAVPKIQTVLNTSFPTATKQYDVKDFTKISAGGSYQIQVTPGKKYSVALTGQEKYLEDVKIENNQGTLQISRKDRVIICFFCTHQQMTLEITMPALDSADISGASSLTAKDFTSDNFEINLSGASKAELDNIITKQFNTKISGASKMNISGQADIQTSQLSGASQMAAEKFITKTANVHVSGASKAYINTTDTLNAKASGASRIYYQGQPKTTIDESGSSRVEKF